MGKRQCHSQSYVSSSCPLLCQKNLYGWQQGCLTWAGKGRLDSSQARDLWAFWELWCHLNIEIVTENKIFKKCLAIYLLLSLPRKSKSPTSLHANLGFVECSLYMKPSITSSPVTPQILKPVFVLLVHALTDIHMNHTIIQASITCGGLSDWNMNSHRRQGNVACPPFLSDFYALSSSLQHSLSLPQDRPHSLLLDLTIIR